MKELVVNTYKYRELIWALALRELKVRYKRSVLGFLWALLNPALLMVVLSVVFSTIMRVAGSALRNFHVQRVVAVDVFFAVPVLCGGLDCGNGDLVKKVSVPKMVFPVAAVVSNIINLLLSLIPLAILVLLFGHPFYWTWIYLPIPMLALIIFTMGATFFFAAANVYYRDVAHIVQVVLSAWFYFTPIIYAVDFIPEKYRWIFKLNPIIYVINGFRLAVYYGMLPKLQSVVASFVCAFVSLFIGFSLFRKYQDNFVFYV